MKKISLCLIVKDEEKVLARCLESMKGAYDELIIVDTGSTDKTVEIAESFGARVEHFKWIDDFAAARNYSFSFATGDWIMWCDADDILKPGDAEKFKAIVYEYDDSDITGINFPYIYSHEAVGSGEMPNFKYHRLRIIKNGVGRWRARIHEYIALNILHKDVKRDDIDFHHYRDEGKGTQNTGRNLRILKKVVDNADDEEKPRYMFYYGKECIYNNMYDEAIEAFKIYLPISKFMAEKHRAMYEMAVAYKYKGDMKQCKHFALKAIEFNEDYCDPYVLLGIIAYEEKRYKDIIKWMQAAQMCSDPVVLFFDFIPYKTYVPWDYMSLAYWNLNEYEKGYEAILKALLYKPTDERYLKNKKYFEDKLQGFKYE